MRGRGPSQDQIRVHSRARTRARTRANQKAQGCEPGRPCQQAPGGAPCRSSQTKPHGAGNFVPAHQAGPSMRNMSDDETTAGPDRFQTPQSQPNVPQVLDPADPSHQQQLENDPLRCTLSQGEQDFLWDFRRERLLTESPPMLAKVLLAAPDWEERRTLGELHSLPAVWAAPRVAEPRPWVLLRHGRRGSAARSHPIVSSIRETECAEAACTPARGSVAHRRR